MPRNLDTVSRAKANTPLATEPVIIIKIAWARRPTTYYSDKTFTLDSLSCEGKIISFGSISAASKDQGAGEISTVNVQLSDAGSDLKNIIDKEIINDIECTVYHHYIGLGEANLTTVLIGKIAGDVSWSEGTRILSFSIESNIEDGEVGFAPLATNVTDLHKDAVNKPWPLCFGTVLKVPTIRAKRQTFSRLTGGINNNFDAFDIEENEDFPTGTPINIRVGKIRYTGTLSGNTFTATVKNLAYHNPVGGLKIKDRLQDDPHEQDASVLWLDDATNYIVGLYCIINHSAEGWLVNYCIRQEANKCYFVQQWNVRNNTGKKELVLDSDETIVETAPVPRDSWNATMRFDKPEQLLIPSINTLTRPLLGVSSVLKGKWVASSGALVRLEVDYNDLYIANLIESTEILEVYAYRQVGNKTLFVPVPSSYYTKTLNKSIGGQTATTLEFPISFEERQDEGWDGEIYVSLRSLKGPNGVDVIQCLLDTYSNLTVDTTSFEAVHSKVVKFPANFAVFDQPNVISLCANIAWQLGCLFSIRNNKAYIKYLAEIPTANYTVTEEETELKSLNLSFTPVEDVITKLTAEWREDYSGEEGTEKEYTYRNNVSSFGLKADNRDFFIYNIEAILKVMACFWGYRYSNVWRIVELKSFLRTLELEVHDTLNHNIGIISTYEIRGVIQNISHDSDNNSISISSILGSKAGAYIGGGPHEDTSNLNSTNGGFWEGDPSCSIDSITEFIDVGEGRTEVDYEVPTSDQNNTTPGIDLTVPSDPNPHFLRWYTQPIEVLRETAFYLRVEVVDYENNLVSTDIDAVINFSNIDPDDTIHFSGNGPVIQIRDGVWEDYNVAIYGGGGTDVGNVLGVAAVDFENAYTPGFTVLDRLSLDLSWITCPPSPVTRGVTFTIKIIGGAESDVLNVKLISSLPADKLYNSSGEVTTITLDGAGGTSGEFEASDWYIEGGQTDAWVGIVISDDADRIYDSVNCNFEIQGLSPFLLGDSIRGVETITENFRYLKLTFTGLLKDDTGFSLKAEVFTVGDVVDTAYNGQVRINLEDDEGVTNMEWLQAGGDAAIAESYGLWVTIENGVWLFANCKISIPTSPAPDSPAHFIGTTTNEAIGARLTDEITQEILFPEGVCTVEEIILERQKAAGLSGDDLIDVDGTYLMPALRVYVNAIAIKYLSDHNWDGGAATAPVHPSTYANGAGDKAALAILVLALKYTVVRADTGYDAGELATTVDNTEYRGVSYGSGDDETDRHNAEVAYGDTGIPTDGTASMVKGYFEVDGGSQLRKVIAANVGKWTRVNVFTPPVRRKETLYGLNEPDPEFDDHVFDDHGQGTEHIPPEDHWGRLFNFPSWMSTDVTDVTTGSILSIGALESLTAPGLDFPTQRWPTTVSIGRARGFEWGSQVLMIVEWEFQCTESSE